MILTSLGCSIRKDLTKSLCVFVPEQFSMCDSIIIELSVTNDRNILKEISNIGPAQVW